MTNHSVHFSSKTPEWPTPQAFFDDLNQEFKFTLDPCATPENAKCSKFFTEKEDGLVQNWDNERVFMNPPYGRTIGQWIKKASEARGGWSFVCCLLEQIQDIFMTTYTTNQKYVSSKVGSNSVMLQTPRLSLQW